MAKNGVLVLASVTGGMRRSEVPSDAINLDFVLGNKVMFGTVNAGREHFEEGVRDMAMSEANRPGWLARLLTHPIAGLDRYPEALAAQTQRGAEALGYLGGGMFGAALTFLLLSSAQWGRPASMTSVHIRGQEGEAA
jgi:hypothetical protein